MSQGESNTEAYVETEEVSINLKSNLTEFFITEDDLSHQPVITAESVPLEQSVSLHIPFFFKWDTGNNGDEFAYSENFVHTQLDKDSAEELLEQLKTALEQLETDE